MAILYHHTQRGTLVLGACLAAASVAGVEVWSHGRWFMTIIPIGLLGVAWLFSSLTIEVNERELRWHFGPGLWTYRLPRNEIETVQIVRNHWWNGFGIRMRPGFRLYNVSRLDAVELRLKSGDVRRIGSDDPQGLTAALKS
jgi:hypothetical protein